MGQSRHSAALGEAQLTDWSRLLPPLLGMGEAVPGTVFNFGTPPRKRDMETLKMVHQRAVTMGRNLGYLPKPQSVTAASCYIPWHYQEVLGPITFVPSLSLAVRFDSSVIRSPLSLLFNNLYQSISLCLSCSARNLALGDSD